MQSRLSGNAKAPRILVRLAAKTARVQGLEWTEETEGNVRLLLGVSVIGPFLIPAAHAVNLRMNTVSKLLGITSAHGRPHCLCYEV
jgi:hypothetical protein